MSLAISALAVGASFLTVGTGRDTRRDSMLREPLTELIAVITFVGDHHFGGNLRSDDLCVGDIGVITGAQQQTDRVPRLIDHRVNFGVHATLGAAHGLRSLPATRIARTAMQLNVCGIDKPLGTLERQLDLDKELSEDPLARPSAVILIDTVPGCVWPIDGTPLTSLA